MQESQAVELLSASNRSLDDQELDQTLSTPLPPLHFQLSKLSRNGDFVAGSDSALSKEQFLEKLQVVVKEAGNHGIVVFVHGSFNDGQRSRHQAIRLSEALQSPVILFDWSSSKFSPAKVLSEGNYIRNQVEADRSEDDFRQFLDTLDASGVPPSVVTFVGFSKGCYIIHRGLLHRFDHMGGHVAACNQFRKVLLISADIDSRTYAAQAERSTANAQRTEIWVNNADTAMTTSFKIHGKEERLGGAKYTLPYVLRNKSITVIDFNDSCVLVKARLRHEMPFELLSALRQVPESMASSRYGLVPDPNSENLQHVRLK
ncbi:MAG: alpha/beta hydrolase [Candidatus Obscuribacterales bacterium]